MHQFYQLVFTFLLVSLSQSTPTHSWGWFSSSTTTTTTQTNNFPSTTSTNDGYIAEFSMESVTNQKGLDKAKQRLSRPDSCWRNAYESLFAGCTEIMNDKGKQSRFAWHLSDCFQRDSGSLPFPHCHKKDAMANCLKNLDARAHSVYLEFYMETNSICHQLQADVFKKETERLVNELKESAQFTEEKLEHIEEKSGQILDNSNQIQKSISSLDSRIDQVAQTSKEVEEQIDVVLDHSKIIFEQTKVIAASQLALQGGQTDMREKLESGMTMLEESYKNLGLDIEKLRKEAIEIEKEITEVGITMSSKMQNLQTKADDIGNVAGLSLDKQKQLLDGQSTALEGLDFLTKFQSQALEESRAALQNLVEFGQKQQEELMRRQEKLQLAHDQLAENSRYILEAQEAFELKQANMFMALDKLFALHNSYLRESRTVKSFCFYFLVIIVLYILTSTKQTYCARVQLYLGLCGMFLAEFAIVRLGGDDLDQQSWIASKIWLARSGFLVLASFQILYSYITYRDYEVLNHNMLQRLTEKVSTIEKHKLIEEEATGGDISLSAWVDTELPEDEDSDPDFVMREEVAESSPSTTSSSRQYNLRPRFHR